VAEHLPLCAATEDLLPGPCRSCAWWQTAGIARVSPTTAATVRTRWTAALEQEWGCPGIIRKQVDTHRQPGTSTSWVVHYAPASRLPRLRDLLMTQMAEDAVFLFCLRGEGVTDARNASMLLHLALKRLKQQHSREAYAFAHLEGGTPWDENCEFFSRVFLQENGFEELHNYGDVVLMRVDLRTLLSVLAPLENALKRLLHSEPNPSPAAWSSRGPA